MSEWRLGVAASAERSLKRLPSGVAAAIAEFMVGPLLENPQRVGHALHHEFEGYRSARRGPYRIVYRIDVEAQTVRVVRIEHRADVHRRR